MKLIFQLRWLNRLKDNYLDGKYCLFFFLRLNRVDDLLLIRIHVRFVNYCFWFENNIFYHFLEHFLVAESVELSGVNF